MLAVNYGTRLDSNDPETFVSRSLDLNTEQDDVHTVLVKREE